MTALNPVSEFENAFNQIKAKCKNVKSHFGVTISPLQCFSDYEQKAFDLIHDLTTHGKGYQRTIFLIENAPFHQFKQFIS